MLSATDNELMCRVGADTPMGKFLREYWIPALLPRSCLRLIARQSVCVCSTKT